MANWEMDVGCKNRSAEDAYFEDFAQGSEALAACGCTVELVEKSVCNLVVIDRLIVWYGDSNVLAFNSHDAQILRFESASVAHDLPEYAAGDKAQ